MSEVIVLTYGLQYLTSHTITLGLYITSLVREKSLSLSANVEEIVGLAVIESAFTFVSAGTSLLATFLIAHRIYYYLNKTQKEIRSRYTHVIEIIIQSVVVYSVALLLLGVSGTIPRLHKDEKAEQVAVNMQDYMTMLTSIIAVRRVPFIVCSLFTLFPGTCADGYGCANHHLRR